MNSPATAGTTQTGTAPAPAAPAYVGKSDAEFYAEVAAEVKRQEAAKAASVAKQPTAFVPQPAPIQYPAATPAVSSGTMLPASAPPPAGSAVYADATLTLPAETEPVATVPAVAPVAYTSAPAFDWKIPAIIGAGLLGMMLLSNNPPKRANRRN